MTTKAWAGPGWSHQPGKQGRPPMLAAGIGVLSHHYCSPGCAFTGSRIQKNWDLKLGNFIMWCRHSRWHLNPSPLKNKVLDKDNTNSSDSILRLCIIYTIHISDEREKSWKKRKVQLNYLLWWHNWGLVPIKVKVIELVLCSMFSYWLQWLHTTVEFSFKSWMLSFPI